MPVSSSSTRLLNLPDPSDLPVSGFPMTCMVERCYITAVARYATLLLGLATLMVSVVAAATADPVVPCDLCKSLQRMPAQYRGTWCFIHQGTIASIYKRCPHKNKHGMEITAAFPIIDGTEGRNTITY